MFYHERVIPGSGLRLLIDESRRSENHRVFNYNDRVGPLHALVEIAARVSELPLENQGGLRCWWIARRAAKAHESA